MSAVHRVAVLAASAAWLTAALTVGPTAIGVAAADERPAARAPVSADVVVLVVEGTEHRFTAEIADTPAERAQGLMFREEMAADHGMLFDFAAERPVSFWMKNTPLPLDMIFARANGEIVRIAEDTVPFSEEAVPSGAPVRFVFEVNAGTARRIGLSPGDRLVHPRVVTD